jgi:hypothetical protein
MPANPSQTVTEGLLRWLELLWEGQRLVTVKRWMPYWCDGYFWGPTMLVDTRAGHRSTVTPRLDRYWLRALFRPNPKGQP